MTRRAAKAPRTGLRRCVVCWFPVTHRAVRYFEHPTDEDDRPLPRGRYPTHLRCWRGLRAAERGTL